MGFDEEDNDTASPHSATPTERWLDGHGRPLRLVQHNTVGGQETLKTKYAWDPLGNMGSITDPADHAKTQSFDSLGRQTGMHDLNAGDWSFEYDQAGNLTHYRDAKGARPSRRWQAARGRGTPPRCRDGARPRGNPLLPHMKYRYNSST